MLMKGAQPVSVSGNAGSPCLKKTENGRFGRGRSERKLSDCLLSIPFCERKGVLCNRGKQRRERAQ